MAHNRGAPDAQPTSSPPPGGGGRRGGSGKNKKQSQTDRIQQLLDELRGQVGEAQGGLRTDINALNELGTQGFDDFRSSQLDLLQQQQEAAVNDRRNALLRAGLAPGSSVFNNELTRTSQGFEEQARALSGQIGLQRLGFKQGLIGQRSDLRQDIVSAGAIPPGLEILLLNAKKAGKDRGGGPFGGLGINPNVGFGAGIGGVLGGGGGAVTGGGVGSFF